MTRYLKWPYKVLRSCLMIVVVLAFLLPASLYVALSLPAVQRIIAEKAEKELTSLLTVDVSIDDLSIVPFNRLALKGVTVKDKEGEPAVRINRLAAGISLPDYLFRGNIVITYVELSGMEARVYRTDPDSPVNIQPIIDALKPKDKTKPPTQFDLKIKTAVIRNSSVTYDVLSVPDDTTRFNPSHIRVSNLWADIVLPRIKNDDFTIDLRRFSLRERSGVKVTDMKGLFHITSHGLTAKGLTLDLSATHLAFGDIDISYDSYDELKKLWSDRPVDIDLLDGSYFGSTDLVPFVPQLRGVDLTFYTELHAAATKKDISIERLDLRTSYGAEVALTGRVLNPTVPDEMDLDIPELIVKADAPKTLDLIARFVSLPHNVSAMIANLGSTELRADLRGTLKKGTIDGFIAALPGRIDLKSDYSLGKTPSIAGNVKFDGFSGSSLMKGLEGPLGDLGNLSAEMDYDLTFNGKIPQGKFKADVSDIVYRDHHFTDITAKAESRGNNYSGSIAVDNPGVYLDLDAIATIDGPQKHVYLNLAARDVEPALFNIDPAHPERRFSVYCIGEFRGPDIDNMEGELDIDDLSYGKAGEAVYLQDFDFVLANDNGFKTLKLNSDVIDGNIEGNYRLSALPRIFRSLVSGVLPALTSRNNRSSGSIMDSDTDMLSYEFTIKDTSPLEPLVSLPVKVIYPVKIDGGLDASRRKMNLRLDAPYLQQGNKLIENTTVSATVRGASELDSLPRADLSLSTMLPTKNGPLTLLTSAFASDNHLDTRVEWKITRNRDYSGDLSLSALFDRNEDQSLSTRLDINPGKLVFNDTVWTVEPSVIDFNGKRAEIHDFRVGRDRQFVSIEGTASDNPSDTITLTLEDVNLDYVFETLDISTAMFGGKATGKFYATDLFSKHPKAFTDGLRVRNLTYNHSLMGDAFIKSSWNPDSRAVMLDADIKQPDERHSYIRGNIKPMADSLDLAFDADHISIGFLLPFMSAFATDISGYASGHARLYGSFKLIDMVGDVYGEDVKLTLGFTNTSYTTTDSVKFRPGRIDIPGITIRDMYGNTAKVDGWVTHECFKSPRFDFRVRDARKLLVYDVKESPETRWFGHILGSGSASIKGVPGLVDISANITTDAGSTFTFVLSDELDAQDYKFITFRDRDRARKDSIARLNAPPEIVTQLKQRMAAQNPESPPSIYKIDITADVTPQAQVTLVMDPVGGDRIRAYGSGNMRMAYDSANEDLRLNGTYTVERGKYNFTLQDIIIKDFTIKDGSSIKFNGDPYAAQLDLAATYSVNANLSDLDESFLADKDLNRTNVPVNAVLLVTGDMRSPDINFDLEFPTLTQDVYRKVRSIVNTEDMMNRQIIYLLALNRFYTPDYMSATKGNEFVSVASSTISSQLSNMLGQLSENWTLAPNFRSDRGDFSDVEVEVALSSHLLNNRLIFNGNLGYRDKALNNNSFIGDFDLEYLLNRRGTIRLKAYNRYNDQNYYVKSALTTQGVGIMFKRDFDNIFSFLRPLKKQVSQPDSVSKQGGKGNKADSVVALPADTGKRTQPADNDFLIIKKRGD